MTLTPTSEYVGKGYTYYYSVDRRTVFHGCQLEYLLANPQIFVRFRCRIACSYRYIYSYDHVYIYIRIYNDAYTYVYLYIHIHVDFYPYTYVYIPKIAYI